MFDFLAAMSYFKTEKPKFQTIILHSLSFLDEILLAELAQYDKIHSFLDNDNPSSEANQKLKSINETLFGTTFFFAALFYAVGIVF